MDGFGIVGGRCGCVLIRLGIGCTCNSMGDWEGTVVAIVGIIVLPRVGDVVVDVVLVMDNAEGGSVL